MKVIVFGSTGAIGRHLIETICKEQPTWSVLAVTRSPSTDKFDHLPAVKVVQGDPLKKDDVLSLSKDANIVYSCIGFQKYERKYWAKHWPIVAENLLAGSSQSPDQKLVFCDNIYAYGAGSNVSPSNTANHVPPSTKSKPAVRAMLWNIFAKRLEEKSMTIVGGADFFGPYVTNTSFLGDTFTRKILEGQSPLAVASATVVHDFCYAPDFARALYIASVDDKAYGKKWICPHTIHGKTMTNIAEDICEISGKDFKGMSVMPSWMVKMLSPFMGFMWEMIEMLPYWSNDYKVDDSDFTKEFEMQATPYNEALSAYVAFYQKEVLV